MAEEDVCEDYRSSLMDLTCNSKPLINMLTMLAEDNVKFAPKIVQVIETHLGKVASDSKLPVLYLIDSIIKNVGGDYLDLFTQNIVSVFCSVFEKVDEKTRIQMFKLRQTWSEIFPSKKMYAIDVRVKGIDPAWPVSAPKPPQKNIHLNPKFLDGKPSNASPATAQPTIVPKTPLRAPVIPSLPELEHSEVRQQLLAKQQELLKLQQQRVELELLQAKLKLEEQIKEQQKKPVNNIIPVTGVPQINSLVSVTNIDSSCTSYTTLAQGLQAQQRNTQQFQQLNSNMLSTSLVADPRINRAVPRLPLRDPRIQKMVPGLIHPATNSTTRPDAAPSLLLQRQAHTQNTPTPLAMPLSSRVIVPPLKEAISSSVIPPIQKSPPKKLTTDSLIKTEPKKQSPEKGVRNSKGEKDEKSPAKSNTKGKTPSPMIIDLTADEDSPKKSAVKGKTIVSKKNNQNHKESTIKKVPNSPDRKKKRVPDGSKRNSSREDVDHYKSRNKDHRSSRSKTRSRSRSRTPPRRNKKAEKKMGKSSPVKNLSPKKSSKLKKSDSNDIADDGLAKTDVDLRQIPIVPNPTGDVDHRLHGTDDKEPPNKKSKFDNELDGLFGKNDQDYRLPMSVEEGSSGRDENKRLRSDGDIDERISNRERQKNWAQYKANHPDEFKSPLKPRENSTEGLNDKDFRIPKHNAFVDDRRRGGFDRLGRPLLSTRPKTDLRHEFFRNQQDDLHIALMLEKQDDILREAAEQMRSGVITTEEYGRVLTKFKNLSEQHQLNRMRAGLPTDSLHLGIQLPPSKPILIDGEMRAIKFFGKRAIVLMDNSEPHEVTFTGTPKSVFLDEKELFTLGFDGETKEFDVDGKTHSISFGAPSREVYVDGTPYAAVFGGNSFPVVIDSQVQQLRIGGPQPNVEISDEPVRGLSVDEKCKDKGDALEKKDLSSAILDKDMRRGSEEISMDVDHVQTLEEPQKELEDVDMRVPPIPSQLDRLRSSPQATSSSPRNASPDRPSRWEPVDREKINRQSKVPGPWDSPRRDTHANSWNSPDRSEWKSSLETPLERRTLLEPGGPVARSNFQNFPGSDDLNKNDSWNTSNQMPPVGTGTSNWDWRMNQPNNFQPGSPKRFDNFNPQTNPNIPPFQPIRPPDMPMMTNMMPGMNQMRGNYRMMGMRGTLDARNYNFIRQPRPAFMMDNQNFGSTYCGGINNNFGQMSNMGMGMPNHNFESQFGPDSRNQPMDNFSGINLGEKRMPLLPIPGTVSSLLPQPPSIALQPQGESNTPLDVSSLLAKLISSGLIKTETSANKTTASPVANENDTLATTTKDTKEEQCTIEAVPPIELLPEFLKTRYSGVIDILYRGTQCASCGMRFKDCQQDKYSQHLDWHFRANRREKDGAKKAFSRKWFYDVEDWYQFEETEDLDDRARSFFELQAGEEQFQADPVAEEIPSVKASQDQSDNNCVVCSEPFQMFWVEEEEEWHLKGAIRKEGKTYHPLCYEDFIKAQAAESVETPLDECVNPLETSLESKAEEESKKEVEEEETKDEGNVENLEDIDTELKEVDEELPIEAKEDDLTTEEIIKENEPTEEETVENTKDPPMQFEEEIIGVISESELPSDEESNDNELKPEPKMVTLQPGGRPGKIVMKVKADSIINPALSTRPETPTMATSVDSVMGNKNEGDSVKMGDKSDDTEEEQFNPPSPDPRFEVFAPVQRGKELSGLCSVM